jgi:hypothetical protein
LTYTAPIVLDGFPVPAALLQAALDEIARLAATAIKPHAFLRQTSNQSIGHGAWTALAWGVEDFDTHGGHDLVTNTSRYTAVVAGTYTVLVRGGFAANSTGHRGVRVAKNGAVVNNSANYKQTTTADVWSDLGSADVHLNVGEYVEGQVIQDSGGAINTSASAGDVGPSMSVTLINKD